MNRQPGAAGDRQDSMPVKAVCSLLRVVSQHGHDVDEVLQTIGLDFNPLLPANQHIDRVPTKIYSRLYRQLMVLLQDEAFGMMVPERSPPGTFRMMCLFIIHCKTLRQALLRTSEFFDYCDRFQDAGGRRRQPIAEMPDHDLALLRFSNPDNPGDAESFAADASVLYMMYRFYSWLVGQNLPLHSVHFVSHDPRAQAQHEPLFGAPVELGQPENCLLLPMEALELPVVQNESSLQTFLKSAPYPLISRTAAFDDGTLTEKVRAIINSEFGRELPSAQDVADALNISARTLHRRLQREGSSYQALKDNLRKDAALSYLQRPDLRISTIALLMGFQDSGAFHRSFKKWTGLSPGQYRRQLAERERGG